MRRALIALVLAVAFVAVGWGITGSTASEPAGTSLTPPVIPAEPFALLPCPAHPRATLDFEGCFEHQVLRTDRQINALVRSIFQRMSSRGARVALVRGERIWLRYRKASCRAQSLGYEGGSWEPAEYGRCTAARNRRHMADLTEIAANFNH